MSDLVENYLECSSNFDLFQQSASAQSNQSILECLLRKISKSQNEGIEIKIEDIDKIRQVLNLFTLLKLPSAIYEYVFRIRVDFRHKKLDIVISFLQLQSKFPKAPSPIRKSLCRKLLKINKQVWKNGSKLVLDIQNGSLTLFNCSDESDEIFKSSHMLWSRIKNKISELVKIISIFDKPFGQLISPKKQKRYLMVDLSQQKEKFKKKQFQFVRLVRQVAMSHIRLDFNDKQQIGINTLQVNNNPHQHNMMRLFSNIKNDIAFIETHKFYSQQISKIFNISIKDFKYDIDPKLQALYASYLKNPPPKSPSSSGQNKFIFNQIQVVKPQSAKMNSNFKEGGLNKIYVSKITFYYCSSNPVAQNQQKTPFYRDVSYINEQGVRETINPILTKTLAIKVPKNQGTQKGNQKYENELKYENEFNIIKTFKNGVSAYILKYYRSEQANFEYRKCLMMDFLPNAQPLSNFIEIFKQTLSLNSKLYLIVNISNGLRFIDDYKIVHMDLNLNNILVYKDYLTKIIDFGEAYNLKVKSSQGNGFKRGYTMPFCCPEYFARKDSFTVKQDVFSLGIIMYRIIFGDYPFFSSDELQKNYKNKSYNKKILLAPQRGQDYGNIEAIDLIYRIIFRCLNQEEQVRCEPTWITILLKIIYYHLV